jgi:hypothetical protein
VGGWVGGWVGVWWVGGWVGVGVAGRAAVAGQCLAGRLASCAALGAGVSRPWVGRSAAAGTGQLDGWDWLGPGVQAAAPRARCAHPRACARPLGRRHVEQHPQTLVTRFFGLHKIKPQNGRKVRCRHGNSATACRAASRPPPAGGPALPRTAAAP